ncbi:hypothetical protein [Streptomyces sp. NPDC013181]|uniref:hypothetical protein n=1 Tax=unclassified Streptomyces TaxID=2593676 RepID=UPI00367768DE
MTALTGVIGQRRHWLRLLVLVGVPILLLVLFSHQAWAVECEPVEPGQVLDLRCEPPTDTPDPGRVMGIFDVVDRNGVPISSYGLNVDSGGTLDVISKIISFLIGIGFSVIRTVIGFACWLIEWALDFGLAKQLLDPVSDVARTIREQVIDNLALKALFLTLVALWAGYLILFKQRSRGWMEVCTSLVIASIATVSLANPGLFLIGNADDTGVLGRTKQFSVEIADVVLTQRCDEDTRNAKKDAEGNPIPATTCSGREKGPEDGVSRPITDGLVDAFIQRPVWVLYTGKGITKECSYAYGQATLARYNFNRFVLPGLVREQQAKGGGWLDTLGKMFSNTFSLDGLATNLLAATGNPWAIYTAVDKAQKDVIEDFKKNVIKKDPSWQTYIDGPKGTDPAVQAACGGGVPMDDQKIAASLDNLLSVWFIALASIIVVALVLAVSCTFLMSQIWMALEVIRAQPALVAGILPGGGRQAMWKWVSGVIRVILAIFLSVMFLAFFLIMVIAVLDADTGEVMTVKFLSIDFIALGFLIFRKKVTAAAKNVSANLGQKMAAKTGGSASVFQGATNGSPSGLNQLKSDGATLSKVGTKVRDLWRGKVPGQDGEGGDAGAEAGADGGANAGKGPGKGAAKGGGKKKGLKERVQGAVKLGTTVAAAVGSGGTSAALQASAKAALKARLKNAAKKRAANARRAATQRLTRSRVGRATLATARTGRYLAKDAPITKSRFKNAVAAEKHNLMKPRRPEPSRAQNAQRDASRQMRQTRSQQRSDGQRLNRVVNGRRSQQQNRRRSSAGSVRPRRPRSGGGGSNAA